MAQTTVVGCGPEEALLLGRLSSAETGTLALLEVSQSDDLGSLAIAAGYYISLYDDLWELTVLRIAGNLLERIARLAGSQGCNMLERVKGLWKRLETKQDEAGALAELQESEDLVLLAFAARRYLGDYDLSEPEDVGLLTIAENLLERIKVVVKLTSKASEEGQTDGKRPSTEAPSR